MGGSCLCLAGADAVSAGAVTGAGVAAGFDAAQACAVDCVAAQEIKPAISNVLRVNMTGSHPTVSISPRAAWAGPAIAGLDELTPASPSRLTCRSGPGSADGTRARRRWASPDHLAARLGATPKPGEPPRPRVACELSRAGSCWHATRVESPPQSSPPVGFPGSGLFRRLDRHGRLCGTDVGLAAWAGSVSPERRPRAARALAQPASQARRFVRCALVVQTNGRTSTGCRSCRQRRAVRIPALASVLRRPVRLWPPPGTCCTCPGRAAARRACRRRS